MVDEIGGLIEKPRQWDKSPTIDRISERMAQLTWLMIPDESHQPQSTQRSRVLKRRGDDRSVRQPKSNPYVEHPSRN